MERDADFLHKKAERATLRVCLRDKYRLPKVNTSPYTLYTPAFILSHFYLMLYITFGHS